MKVLIIGGGGREHALAWKCAQSPLAKTIFVAPGNAGTKSESGQVVNVNIGAEDINKLLEFAVHNEVGLTIVGPEAPLADGIVDEFQRHNLAIFGPTREAAKLESSKSFCKDFMQRHSIPTAGYRCFDDYRAVCEYLEGATLPTVIKADGIAAGKGVIIAQTTEEARTAADAMLNEKQFGEAGTHLVVEDFLQGEEASFICLADGKNLLPLASSQDHKAANDGDTGPNTGGMGAYSPAPVISAKVQERVMEQVMRPALEGMAKEGHPFVGFLYAGLMIDQHSNPSVLEFNCRMGDPETQPLLMRMRSDLVELCLRALEGKLNATDVEWDTRPAIGIVLAAEGYPGPYRKGDEILGLDAVDSEHTKVFHAGTQIKDNRVVTNGGRVLCVVSLGDGIAKAQQRAYENCRHICWDGIFYRKDIGWRALRRD